jgi:hypothetical protein
VLAFFDQTAKPRKPLPANAVAWINDHSRAREAGRKSGETRRANKLARLNQDKPTPPDLVQRAINEQLLLVQEQIKRTRDVLNDEDCDFCEHCGRAGIPAHHRAQLVKALDALLDRQRKLLGVPDPGRRRPIADRPRRNGYGSPEPVEPVLPSPESAPAPTPQVAPAPAPAADG